MRHALVLAALAAFAALVLLAGCGAAPHGEGGHGGGHGQQPPSKVPVAEVIARDMPVMRELTGRIEALDYVELRPRVSGVVDKVVAAEGSEVAAGDVILEIDPRPLRMAVSRAEAEVARNEARLALARQQLKRADDLFAQDVMSPQQHDELAANVHSGQAELAAARAALETAQLDLGWSKVTAPVAGRIGKILTTAGNLVQGGGPVPATLLTTIVSLDPVDAVFDLDEGTWRRLGDALRASQAGKGDVPVAVGVAGEEGFPHPGVVRFVDNVIDTASGSIRLRARVANPDRVMTPGAFARVQLQIEPPKPTVLVHERAVLTQLASRFVVAVDAEGRTSQRPVKLGDSIGQLRVVVEGLAPGDRIAVGGDAIAKFGMMFFPGMSVEAIPASMETLQPLEAPPAPEAAQDAVAPTAAVEEAR